MFGQAEIKACRLHLPLIQRQVRPDRISAEKRFNLMIRQYTRIDGHHLHPLPSQA